ncbi:MAG: acetyl-CoA carboxylase biotin carboxyl carrier protein [Acidobacteriota bacterium]
MTRELVALADGEALRAPAPGWFHRTVAPDHLVAAGDPIGELEILGRVVRVVAPHVHGLVELPEGTGDARRAVGYGDVLVLVTAATALGPADPGTPAAVASARDTAGLVFRAPSSGRFYGRPTPDKAAFVAAGSELSPGDTVCLLEVMKTFHRVTYGGGDVPPRARVMSVLVADGADVNAGDPLLALEPV